jgi:murein DD-endopeptidase MepM/ murein hydrolase activator NlpD
MNETLIKELSTLFILGTRAMAGNFIKIRGMNDNYRNYLASDLVHPWDHGDPAHQKEMVAQGLDFFQDLCGIKYPVPVQRDTGITDFWQSLGLTGWRSWPHGGIDIGAPLGTEIKPGIEGRIVHPVLNDKKYGNYIGIDIGSCIIYFSHCQWINQDEDFCGKNTVIGTVGNTGKSTGPHIHLSKRINGKQVNPLGVF